MTLCAQLRQLVYQLVHRKFESFGGGCFAAVGGMACSGCGCDGCDGCGGCCDGGCVTPFSAQGSSHCCVATWDEISSRSPPNIQNDTPSHFKYPTLFSTLRAGGSAFTSAQAIAPWASCLEDRLTIQLHEYNTYSLVFIVFSFRSVGVIVWTDTE